MTDESVEGRIGGVYRLSDTAMQKLLDESYEDCWIDGVLLVDGEEVMALDMANFWCEPEGDIAVVMMCAPYERADIHGTISVEGTGLLTVDGEEFEPRHWGPYIAEYAGTSEAHAAVEQIMAETGDSDAALAKWAEMTGDPDATREITQRMEEDL